MSKTSPIPAEVFHVSEFIVEEMEARGWDRDRLAQEMGGDFGVSRYVVDLILELRRKDMHLGDKTCAKLARAFGTSAEFWFNLDDAWRSAQP